MRIALLIPMLLLMAFASPSALALETADNGLSCEEVIDVVKHSDCAELVKPLMEGSYITAGLALRSLSVTIKDNSDDSTLAHVRDTAVPAPFISLELKPSYFDDSSFGWGVGFNYGDAYALDQRVIRNGKNKDVDLGTYLTTTMLALTPNAFYQFGDHYSDRYFRIGIGAALGFASIRGTAILTEDKLDTECYQAGNDLVHESGPSTQRLRVEAIKSKCQQQNYNQSSLGLGGNFFMQGQYSHWQASINIANLLLTKNNRKLEPSIISFQVAYVIPL
ncbi:MAG: hypothetical protein V7765_06030 [Oleispira sp.]